MTKPLQEMNLTPTTKSDFFNDTPQKGINTLESPLLRSEGYDQDKDFHVGCQDQPLKASTPVKIQHLQ